MENSESDSEKERQMEDILDEKFEINLKNERGYRKN